MLFKKFLIEKILSGEKTETRRLWARPMALVGSIHNVQPDLRSSFKKIPPPCRIKILRVYPERLSLITPESVKREGFPDGDVEKFIAGFKDINAQKAKAKGLVPEGVSWNDWDPVPYVVKFKIHVETQQPRLF
jgi:hypothetical protein